MIDIDNSPASQEPIALQREAQAWVVLLDSRRATAEDAQAFRRWCEQSRAHATAFTQASKVWQAMQPAASGLARDGRVEHSGFARPASGNWLPHGMPRPGRRAFLGGAVAATAAYLAVRPPLQLWPSVTSLAADYRTGIGEQREVIVAGDVVVQMNTRTRINVLSGIAGANGIDLLQGEAEIVADAGAARRFTVTAGGGSVVATNAQFNVRYTDEDVCVTCLAGEVDIEHGQQRVTLGAARQLRYGADGLQSPSGADVAAVTAWRQRLLVFNQAPLSTVVDEINRYRPGKLILLSAQLGRSPVQASLSIDRLGDVAELIRNIYGAKVTELPGGIVLLGQADA
jgi:ferric-dicitrate binding protein FerR (iron transport regulator)